MSEASRQLDLPHCIVTNGDWMALVPSDLGPLCWGSSLVIAALGQGALAMPRLYRSASISGLPESDRQAEPSCL